MRVLDCEQGSQEWLEARMGIPTASRFSRILTPKTRKLSAQRERLKHELLAESYLGYPIEWEPTQFMERGTDLEDRARAWYEFDRDVEVREVGFCLRDDGLTGCSPDGLVGDDGGLEIKCRGAAPHMAALLGDDDIADMTQIMGSLWITGREWWDVLAFNPAFPSVRIRVYRDEDYIADLAAAVDQFLEELAEGRELLERVGETGRSEDRRAA